METQPQSCGSWADRSCPGAELQDLGWWKRRNSPCVLGCVDAEICRGLMLAVQKNFRSVWELSSRCEAVQDGWCPVLPTAWKYGAAWHDTAWLHSEAHASATLHAPLLDAKSAECAEHRKRQAPDLLYIKRRVERITTASSHSDKNLEQ